MLDACVLFPLAVADALISVAVERAFQAKWTTTIEREWIDALERQRPDLIGRLGYRRDCMREAIPDWMVPEELWAQVELNQTLPDSNDMHVLAAAIACDAGYTTRTIRDRCYRSGSFPNDTARDPSGRCRFSISWNAIQAQKPKT